jgi:hypothetical protein
MSKTVLKQRSRRAVGQLSERRQRQQQAELAGPVTISADLLKLLIEKPAGTLLDDHVMTLTQFWTWVGISKWTGRRLRDKGEGPIITQLTDRKEGVRVKHGRAWLDSRAVR